MTKIVFVTVKLEIITNDGSDDHMRDIMDEISYDFKPSDEHNESVTIREATLTDYHLVDKKGNLYEI